MVGYNCMTYSQNNTFVSGEMIMVTGDLKLNVSAGYQKYGVTLNISRISTKTTGLLILRKL